MERDEKGRFVKRRAKVKIEFLSWVGRAALEVEAESVKDAVKKSVKDGANLDGANLEGANLEGANLEGASLRCANLRCASLDGASLDGASLDGANLEGANLRFASLEGANLRFASLEGAKYGGKELWAARPVLQLGPCGSVGRQTVIFFFADGSAPMIRCGCFRGTLEEFREKIHETHGGTFHEAEYKAMAAHIAALIKIQKKELKNEHK